jgi:hemoglobin-like flavoprotein
MRGNFRLFTNYPNYLKSFPRFRKINMNELSTNKALQAHAVQFMKGMSAMAENIDDLECLDELLYKIAARHQPLKLQPRDMKVRVILYIYS